MTPTISNIKRRTGVAGQYSIYATVQYPKESPRHVEFASSVYGGPVVMVTDSGQTVVSAAVTERLGSKLTESWVREFFS